MRGAPWWIERVQELARAVPLARLELGALWNLSEELRFVRENVDPVGLDEDFRARSAAGAVWKDFQRLEQQLSTELDIAIERQASRIRARNLGPAQFRAMWEGLGFVSNPRGGGTPADDHLDATFRVPRLALDEARPELGMPNMSSRALRVADFLKVTAPQEGDVVVDIGSGSGKVALTVAASTQCRVEGVECGAAYVDAARNSARLLGLENVAFHCADVRVFDLSIGNVFYLYYPFHGRVAEEIAGTLARIAREKRITVYCAGPSNDFGQYFLQAVSAGAFRLSERRGDFSEVLVLRSV